MSKAEGTALLKIRFHVYFSDLTNVGFEYILDNLINSILYLKFIECTIGSRDLFQSHMKRISESTSPDTPYQKFVSKIYLKLEVV